MNLNFVNVNTVPGDIIPLAMGIDAGTGVEGIGKGASFADRLMAVLSPETPRTGKITGSEAVLANIVLNKKGVEVLGEILVAGGISREDVNGLVEDFIDEKNGGNILLPISDLPFITSILDSFQISKQQSTRLIDYAKEEGVGIDLDRLIKGLQTLQKESYFSGVGFDVDSQPGGVEQMFKSLGLEIDEGDTSPLTLGDFVSALEKLRISSGMTAGAETEAQQEPGSEEEAPAAILTSLQIPEQLSRRLDGQTMGEGLGIDLGRLIKRLHELESEQRDTDPLTFSGFVAALEQLEISSLQNPEQRSSRLDGETMGEGLGIDLGRLIKRLHELESEQSDINPLAFSSFVAALEQLEISSLQNLEQRSSRLDGQTMGEGLGIDLGRLIKRLHELESEQCDTDPLTFSGFVAALEQLEISSLQNPEQRSSRLDGETMGKGLGIDLGRLIKRLHELESEQSDTNPLAFSSFVAALEQLEISSLQNLEQRSSRLDGQTMGEGLGIDLGRLIKRLHELESEQSDTNPLAFSSFVAALEQLEISSGLITGAETGLKPGAKAGMEINLDLPVPGAHDNGKQERNTNFVILRDLVAALEKMDISPGPTSLEFSSSKLTGESDAESILGSLISSISRNKGQSMETGGRFKQAESSPGEISTSNPVDHFGVKGDPKSQTPTLPEMQAGVDLEFPRSMENLAAVIKEMKSSVDDTRMMERGVTDRQMAKEPGRNVAAIDSSGGAGGEFRQMGMDSRGQSVADAGTPRAFLPSHVTGQVGKSLARAVSQGDTELKLQLKPPELGRIIMTIDNIGNSLKVSVVTESHAAKEILAAHVNELKATLANSGISIGSFDVEMGSDFSQSMADARHQSKGSGSKRGRNRGAGIEEIGGDSKIDVRGFADDARSLHFVA